ncbi:MAG: Rne/Rng family ribonuclease [Rhodospirillales bacterium]
MTMKRMLIDASHPEETRIVIANGNRLEDFDVEVESRKQLKGNIYLAKVTRVEPSLQAAFVDYGGNRHGFLAFNEIHPDYYQIPVADREALMAEDVTTASDYAGDENTETNSTVETLGGDDTDEVEERRPRQNSRRNYRIQEVVKRGQILLIQVVKEERGGKGAALTTYLSLAGRYCVLMPNTARGGGISRKISNGIDRKRLKVIVNDLGIPDGIAVIVRTAGSKRSKAEIKRDYEYLLRLWTQIRETTLESIAPCAVHEEGNLIKRSIRDLYTKEIEEVVVSGDDGYRMAKDFMKLLIPSHAKRVQPYKDEGVSLTQRYQVEDQLSAIHSPEVHMRSGGYIVINPTEALVSIDVNSGKATKERNIEETAYKTNMEAAEEIARQLKLRDLAGLIVIDFIDMEASRNQTRVERQLKDAMRNDRARIQIGRISPFGLLELSRQRLRPSLLETSSESCPHCEGTGVRRSTDSTALHILRMLEDECTRRKADELTLFVPTSVALYLLNYKRKALADVETRYETTIIVENDDTLIPPDCRIERNGDVKVIEQPKLAPINNRPNKNLNAEDDAEDEETDDGSKRRKRRRGRRRKRSDNDNAEVIETTDTSIAQNENSGTESSEEAASKDGEEGQDTRRRRGRRGGRNRGRKPEDNAQTETEETAEAAVAAAASNDAVLVDDAAIPAVKVTDITEEDVVEAPKPRRRRRRKTTEGAQEGTADVQVIPITVAEAEVPEASAEEAPEAEVEATPEVKEEESPKKTARKPRRKVAPKKAKEETESAGTAPVETASTEAASVEEVAEAPKPKRRRRAKAVVKEVATAEAPVITTEVKTPTPEPVAKEPVPEVEEKLAKKGWWRR